MARYLAVVHVVVARARGGGSHPKVPPIHQPDASLLKAQLRFGPGRACSHQCSETRAETSTLAAYSALWSEAWRCQPFARPRAKPAGRCHARANAPNSRPTLAASKSTPF